MYTPPAHFARKYSPTGKFAVGGGELADRSEGADFFGGRNKFLALAAKKCVNELD
jgi:hypothetical protein